VQELARQHTADAIEALVEALKRPKEAVPAAVALLNRGWGLPAQPLAADRDGGKLEVEFRWRSDDPQPATINGHAVEAEPDEPPAITFIGEC
jgi:hypothetical protein